MTGNQNENDAFKAELDALLAETQARSELIDAVGWALADEAEKIERLRQQTEINRAKKQELMALWEEPQVAPPRIPSREEVERKYFADGAVKDQPMPRYLRSAVPN